MSSKKDTEALSLMLKTFYESVECGFCQQILKLPIMFGKCSHNCCSHCYQIIMKTSKMCPTCSDIINKSTCFKNTVLTSVIEKTVDLKEILERFDLLTDESVQILTQKEAHIEEIAESTDEETNESFGGTVLSTSSICNEMPNKTRNEQIEIKVECPICAVKISAKKINNHLDMCSLKDERRSSLRKERKRKRKFGYLYKD